MTNSQWLNYHRPQIRDYERKRAIRFIEEWNKKHNMDIKALKKRIMSEDA